MMRIVVVGAGGHARVVIETLVATGLYDIVGVLDPNQELWGKHFFAGYIVLGDDHLLIDMRTQNITGCFIALGPNKLRASLYEQASKLGFEFINAIHPQSCISGSVQIGQGVAIMAGAVVNANTVIGNNVIINTGATIDHDCTIGNHVHIAPGCHISGYVDIGDGSMLGTGASVIDRMSIGSWSMLGAGSVVVTSIPSHIKAMGVPAKEYQRIDG